MKLTDGQKLSKFVCKNDANLPKTHYNNNETEVLHINDTWSMNLLYLIVVGPKISKILDMIKS